MKNSGIIDWEWLKKRLTTKNKEFLIFDFEILELYNNKIWGNVDILNNCKKKLNNDYFLILYLELTNFLDIMKAQNLLQDNLINFLMGITENEIFSKTNSNTQSDTRNTPYNKEATIYGSETISEQDNLNEGKSTTKNINYSDLLKNLQNLREYLIQNNIYRIIIDKLSPLYRMVEFC